MTIQLRPTPVLSAWASINPLALPVLPEGPPSYEEISSNDYFDHLQSAIMVNVLNYIYIYISHMSSENVFLSI